MTQFTERFKKIRQGLEQACVLGLKTFGSDNHSFMLNSPITLKELEAFEQKEAILLPQDYRQFLLEVGNGGAGQDYGLFPVQDWRFCYEGDAEKPLSLLCPLHPDMSQDLGFKETSNEEFFQGALTIATQGCTYVILLVVTGKWRGKIVYADMEEPENAYFARFPDFLTWYETWLRELLAGYRMSKFGYGLPLSEPQLVELICDHDALIDDREAAINTLIRAPQLETTFLTQLERILPETTFGINISLLNLLLKQGVTGLDSQVQGLFERSSGAASLSIVYSLQTVNNDLWLVMARRLLEKDEPEISSNVLFLLSGHEALQDEDVHQGFASRYGDTRSTAVYVNSKRTNALETPIELFTDPHPMTRRNAVEYLKDGELLRHLSRVQELLYIEPDAYVRQGWVICLGKLLPQKIESVTNTLLECLNRETTLEVLDALVHAFGKAQIREAVSSLISLTQHEDGLLRLFVAQQLGLIGDRRAIPALKKLVDQKFSPTRFPSKGASGYGDTIANVAQKAINTIRSQSGFIGFRGWFN